MIYIVHGEDLSKSRILIQNQQKKLNSEGRIEVDITETTPEQLIEKTHSNDLFGNPPFIILDVTSSGRMNVEKHIEALQKTPEETTVIILSGKSLPQTNAFIKNASLLKARVNANEVIPQSNIFKLVDAIFSKQREKAYSELSKLLQEGSSPYEIVPMILYGLRNVAAAKFNSPSFAKSHSFVKGKSQSQGALFSEDKIKQLFEEFRILDMKSKLSEIDETLLVPMFIEKVINS